MYIWQADSFQCDLQSYSDKKVGLCEIIVEQAVEIFCSKMATAHARGRKQCGTSEMQTPRRYGQRTNASNDKTPKDSKPSNLVEEEDT